LVIVPTEKRFDWNNAPIALFFIVILNVLVFYAYQTGDDVHFEEALTVYINEDMYAREEPLYKTYLTEQQAFEELAWFEELQQHPNPGYPASVMLQDEAFHQYLLDNAETVFEPAYRAWWQQQRAHIHDLLYSVSFQQYGLVANDLSLTTLLTHQFLHAGTMHLIGNMFFLIICGFAVEAAIGHGKFLLFYLLTGIGGGLAQALIDLESTIPLVGASGAVSGVMAMYLGIFRLKKIEFFYWFIVFVGYFRAPALFILPFYIGNELVSMWLQPESSVAFMAHVGGFATGAVLMGITLLMKPETFNQQYIEADQSAPADKLSLEHIYQLLERCQLNAAGKALNEHLKKHGSSFDLQLLNYKISQVSDPDQASAILKAVINQSQLNEQQLRQLESLWLQLPAEQRPQDPATRYQLAWHLISVPDCLDQAVKLFHQLHQASERHPSLNQLAQKLAHAYRQLENRAESERYSQLARELS
jgi:membrane associated rhomboid family serine protease